MERPKTDKQKYTKALPTYIKTSQMLPTPFPIKSKICEGRRHSESLYKYVRRLGYVLMFLPMIRWTISNSYGSHLSSFKNKRKKSQWRGGVWTQNIFKVTVFSVPPFGCRQFGAANSVPTHPVQRQFGACLFGAS